MDTREAVARALCKLDDHKPDTKTPTGRLMWTLWLDDAEAAIAAHLQALSEAGYMLAKMDEFTTRVARDMNEAFDAAEAAMIQESDNG